MGSFSYSEELAKARLSTDDIKIRYYDPDQGRADGFGLDRQRGVELTYLPTSAKASASLGATSAENLRSAFKRLLTIVKVPEVEVMTGEIDLALLKKRFDNGVLISKVTVGKLIDAAIAKMYMETRLIDEAFNSGVEAAAGRLLARQYVDSTIKRDIENLQTLKRKIKQMKTTQSMSVRSNAVVIQKSSGDGFDIDVYPDNLTAALALIDDHIVQPGVEEDMPDVVDRAKAVFNKVHASISDGLEGIALDPLPALHQGPDFYAVKTKGAAAVLAERQKQHDQYGNENDDAYKPFALACAAVASVTLTEADKGVTVEGISMANLGHRNNMIRAAASLIAEIEKMDRAAAASAKSLVNFGGDSDDPKVL